MFNFNLLDNLPSVCSHWLHQDLNQAVSTSKGRKKEENFQQKLPSNSIKLCSKSILKRASQHETNHLACYAEDLTAFTISGKFMSPTIQQNKSIL